MLQCPMRNWHSPSVFPRVQERAGLLPAWLSLQSRVWLHALQPGPSPFHCLQQRPTYVPPQGMVYHVVHVLTMTALLEVRAAPD